jgi:hypothetical protein
MIALLMSLNEGQKVLLDVGSDRRNGKSSVDNRAGLIGGAGSHGGLTTDILARLGAWPYAADRGGSFADVLSVATDCNLFHEISGGRSGVR